MEGGEITKVQCPNCGAWHESAGGAELEHCTVCGWCNHPYASIDSNGREICVVCRRVIKEADGE